MVIEVTIMFCRDLGKIFIKMYYVLTGEPVFNYNLLCMKSPA